MTRFSHLAVIVFTAAMTAAVAAQNRSFMSAEHAGAKATVMILDDQASLVVGRAGAGGTIELGKGWKKITLVRFSPDASRLAILSSADTVLLTIVDTAAASVLATYPVADAAIAPDGRAVVFEHVRGGQGAGGTRFALVPLNADAAAAKALAVLPGTERGFLKQSRFQWMDPEVVAFVATVANEASVLAYQLDGSGRVQTSGVKPLPGSIAAEALARAEITRVPSAGLTLRVQLPGGAQPSELRLW